MELNSTQFTRWLFTPEELTRVRRLRTYKAFKYLSSRDAQQGDSYIAPSKDESIGENGSAGAAESVPLPKKPVRAFAPLLCGRSAHNREKSLGEEEDITEPTDAELSEMEKHQHRFLTADEEETIKFFFEDKIRESCALLRTSDKVQATAVILFKRFFLSNSVMEHHPKNIMLASLYVAGKVEEHYLKVDTIADELQVDFADILQHEMILLEGVRFQLICYHPFRPLLGFIDDARRRAKENGEKVNDEDLQKLHINANALVKQLLLTDAPLLFAPAQIALAVLSLACNTTKTDGDKPVLDFDQYIRGSLPKKGEVEKVLAAVEEIQRYAGEPSQPPDKGELKRVNKKIKPFFSEEKKRKAEDGEQAEPGERKRKKQKSSKKHKKSKGETVSREASDAET